MTAQPPAIWVRVNDEPLAAVYVPSDRRAKSWRAPLAWSVICPFAPVGTSVQSSEEDQPRPNRVGGRATPAAASSAALEL